jgi:hypothetical protein
LVPLDLEVAASHVYDPTHYQAILFCAESFDQMDQMLREFLVRWQPPVGTRNTRGE